MNTTHLSKNESIPTSWISANLVIMKMIKLMTEDMTKTIDFLDHECTGDQFAWLSEIFEEIAEASQSHEFIAALRRAAKRYPEETKQFNIISFIDDAETYITD